MAVGSAPRRWSPTRAIQHVAAADPALDALVHRVGPIAHRPRNPDGHFGALVRSIVFQQLAGARPTRSTAACGRSAGAARRRGAPAACPTPPARRRAVRRQARLAARPGRPRCSTAPWCSTAPAAPRRGSIARLVTVRGIGRWTAEMYLMFELRRPDVWPVDDLGVRQGYGLACGIDPPPPARGRPAGRPLPALPLRRRPLHVGGRRAPARRRHDGACADATASSGLLLQRAGQEGVEVLVAHMGGPFWAKKDEGAWSIPKGETGGRGAARRGPPGVRRGDGRPPPDGPTSPSASSASRRQGRDGLRPRGRLRRDRDPEQHFQWSGRPGQAAPQLPRG